MESQSVIQNSFLALVKNKSKRPFVDKTDLIADLNSCIDDPSVKLKAVTRPRRFGKTVTAEMLRLYYSKEYNFEEVKEIFSGLKISQDPSFLEHLHKYTVIYWDMNDLIRSFRAFEGKNHPKVKNFIDNIQYQSIKTLKENPEFAKIIDEANSEVDLP